MQRSSFACPVRCAGKSARSLTAISHLRCNITGWRNNIRSYQTGKCLSYLTLSCSLSRVRGTSFSGILLTTTRVLTHASNVNFPGWPRPGRILGYLSIAYLVAACSWLMPSRATGEFNDCQYSISKHTLPQRRHNRRPVPTMNSISEDMTPGRTTSNPDENHRSGVVTTKPFHAHSLLLRERGPSWFSVPCVCPVTPLIQNKVFTLSSLNTAGSAR